MPRIILDLGPGVQANSVAPQALQVQGVSDARPTRAANTVIVTVDELTTERRQELANLPGVDRVFDDIQAVPQVADREAEDFLKRVRELKGEEETPPLLETEPTVGELRPDGGVITVPPQTAAPEPGPQTGPIRGADDSISFIGARALHEAGNTGEGAICVVVDTGVDGDNFAEDRQLEGADLTGQDDPWTLFSAHGGMTAGIMAGGPETPGIEVGVAPGADVFPIKSTLAASELLEAQDIIIDLAEENDKPVVVNNSWGFSQCAGICDHPVTRAIRNAADHPLVTQVFAAGNQGGEGVSACGAACDGSTVGISGPNSLDNVIAVAASGLDGEPNQLQPYSSRGGPGEVSCGSEKPDVSAPIFGNIPWGAGSRNIGNGGGTSGACPQVAGAIALIVSESGPVSLSVSQRSLRASAKQFRGSGFDGCSGFGNIQADDALGETGPATAGGFGPIIGAGAAAGFLGALGRRFLQ